jgi:hypothetical protein
MKIPLIAALPVAVLLAACGTSAPRSEPGATYTRTIVTLDPDGTSAVREETVTAEQQAAEVAAREAALRPGAASGAAGQVQEAISDDTSCAGASLWIFDQPGLTGREICFTGSGTAHLASYCRAWMYKGSYRLCVETWSTATRSYYSGYESGYFTAAVPDAGSCSSTPSGSTCIESFGAYAQVQAAGQYASEGTDVTLTN